MLTRLKHKEFSKKSKVQKQNAFRFSVEYAICNCIKFFKSSTIFPFFKKICVAPLLYYYCKGHAKPSACVYCTRKTNIRVLYRDCRRFSGVAREIGRFISLVSLHAVTERTTEPTAGYLFSFVFHAADHQTINNTHRSESFSVFFSQDNGTRA